MQDVGWDLNISQGSFLFPCPCQESGSAGVFRIMCPGEPGAGGGWSSLSQSWPESAAPTRPRARNLVLLLELADMCARITADDSEGAVFTDTLPSTKSLQEFGFTLQNPYVTCCLSPREICLHSDMLFFGAIGKCRISSSSKSNALRDVKIC